MKNFRTLGILCSLVLLCAVFTLNSQADQWNKKTILTVNETLQIPGATLTPGKYVFKLMDSQSNRHIVQVFNEDESQLITTILAIPNERLRPTGKTEFGFWEMPQGSPPALRSWFYPGDLFGQEFAYPKTAAQQIAAATQQPVPAISDEAKTEDLKTAEVSSEAQTSAAPTPPATPAPAETTTPDTTSTIAQATPPADTSRSESAASTLPATASPLPLVGLIGFFSLGLSFVVRIIRQYLS